jgi:hypothetical protein
LNGIFADLQHATLRKTQAITRDEFRLSGPAAQNDGIG